MLVPTIHGTLYGRALINTTLRAHAKSVLIVATQIFEVQFVIFFLEACREVCKKQVGVGGGEHGPLSIGISETCENTT